MNRRLLWALSGSLLIGTMGLTAMREPIATSHKITISFWTISLKPTFDNYINGEIRGFEHSHPNVTVQWDDFPESAIEPKLLATIAANSGVPNVVNLDNDMVLGMAGEGAMVNLNQAATPAERSIYFPEFWKSGALGKGVYGFPWYVTPSVMMYNAALFQKAGLNPNDPPTTKAQEVADAKVFKKKLGIYGFMPSVGLTPMVLNGIPILNKTDTKAAFDTPKGVAMVQYYVNLLNQGLIPADTVTKGYEQAIIDYESGDMAMLNTGPQFLTEIQKDAPTIYKETRTAPIPTWSTGLVSAPLMELGIPSKASYPKISVEFASYMTNNYSQLAFDKIVDIMPSTIKASKNSFFTHPGITPIAKARKVSAEELPHSVAVGLGVSQENQINTDLTNAIEAAMDHSMTAKAALQQAAKEVNQLMTQGPS